MVIYKFSLVLINKDRIIFRPMTEFSNEITEWGCEGFWTLKLRNVEDCFPHYFTPLINS